METDAEPMDDSAIGAESLDLDTSSAAMSNPQEDDAVLAAPLLPASDDGAVDHAPGHPDLTTRATLVRRPKTAKKSKRKQRGVRSQRQRKTGNCLLRRLCCCQQNKVVRCMNLTARVVLWSTIVALCVGVVWYSYELAHNGYVLISLTLLLKSNCRGTYLTHTHTILSFLPSTERKSI
jgi:hypothetical protein